MVNYYALPGEPTYEEPTFKRSNAWEATRQEVMAVRDGVGINELQNFGKYLVKGPNARAWLDRIMAGSIPKPGRLSLTPMLAHSGKIIGDFTVSCLSETEFQLTASYGAQGWHYRWFEQNAERRRHGRKHLGQPLRLHRSPARTRANCWPRSPAPTSPPTRSNSWTCATHDRRHGQLHRAARQLYRRSRL